ncbi:MAG: S8 family serine peptidase [Armatimonadetes bacterium]|nr:S8 family serine peptidase [Armatimonadota bacterium]
MRLRFISLFALGAVCAAGAAAQGRIITQLQPGHSREELPLLFPVSVQDWTPEAPFVLLEALPGNDVHAVQQAMRDRPDVVVFAEDDQDLTAPENVGAGKGGTVAAVFDPGGAYEENKGLFAQIRWKPNLAPLTGRPVKVAVLDTGVSKASKYLRIRTVAAANFAPDRNDPFDLPSGSDSNGNGTPDDAVGHGSMVTGLIALMAPYAQIVVARVADSDGDSSAWALVRGLAYSCAQGAEVVNISLGKDGGVPALSNVIEGWVEPNGVLVVAAAGNDAVDKANSPARLSKSISVAGLDADDVKAPFSNWDGNMSLCAPCVGVRSVWWDGSMGLWSGTSFASPLVAGSLANALRQRPVRLAPIQLELFRDVLSQVGTDVDRKNRDYRGRLGLKLDHFALQNAVRRF